MFVKYFIVVLCIIFKQMKTNTSYKRHREVDTSAFSLRALAIKLNVKPATLRYRILFNTLTDDERRAILEALCDAANGFIKSKYKLKIVENEQL